MSYVYIRQRSERLFTVGFYEPNGDWNPESDHGNREDAVARVNLLNGGCGCAGKKAGA
ncbi:hypothetical protein [Nocardia sp. NPDC050435]|uniref:hypothetical protein n=1 Tax=Nocardia sp. NPDC050435 TaxID=3155040 RepID=UPI00340D0953